MNDLKNTGSDRLQGYQSAFLPGVVVVLSVVALVCTYLLANSAYDVTVKTRGFSVIVASFLIASVGLFFWHSRGRQANDASSGEGEISRQLQALADANEFFAGSLRPVDSFRLVASRVREILRFRTITLHLYDEVREGFFVTESDGPDAGHRRGRFFGFNDGPVSRSYLSKSVEIERATHSARPVAAVPLISPSGVFGVLHFDFDLTFDPDTLDLHLLDAIGTRSAPLMLSSISYEQSHTNALTDATTELPNERAFYMVLEKQVAESQRKGTLRPLTVLAVDVRSFDEINSRFGHAAGDRVLAFVANVIKDNLRQMDYLARAGADEFVIALPTASKEISHDVVARVQTGFFGRKFKVTERESVEIELNIGWAAFGTDGESPQTLLRVARERKEQSKTSTPSKVLWFPTEFAS